MSNSIKANTYVKIAFNLGNGKDVLDISKAMMFNSEETLYIDFLPVGSAIIKLKGRFFQPILVHFPLISIFKGLITDKTVSERMSRL